MHEIKVGYDFDDVLIIPQHSILRSRTEPSTKTLFCKGVEVSHPIVPANMDCIAGPAMKQVQKQNGGAFIWHRFCPQEDIESGDFVTVGMRGFLVDKEDWLYGTVGRLNNKGAHIVIDIAHAHSDFVLEAVREIKELYPNMKVVVGNVATPEAARELCLLGVDAVKVGIGPGAACTTRKVTGCGVPQLTAIQWCAEACSGFDVPVIADGGIRASDHVAKAIAAGASTVMVGFVLAGADEADGQVEVTTEDTPRFYYFDTLAEARKNFDENQIRFIRRKYSGQSSEDFQVQWYGGLKTGVVPEGTSIWVDHTGPAQKSIDDLLGGFRSSMTYVGAKSVESFQKKARFVAKYR